MIGHIGYGCPTFILTGHCGETSQDAFLQRAFVTCSAFRGKDKNNLSQLFRDNLHELYDRLFDIDADTTNAPEDFYTTILKATEAARASHISELDALLYSIYLFELYTIVKTGVANSPYACIEWL